MIIELPKTNCCKCTMGMYENYITLDAPDFMKKEIGKDKISIHKCLQDIIKELWRLKIVTLGCCCGHGVEKGYIQIYDKHAGLADFRDQEEKNAFNFLYRNNKQRIYYFPAINPKTGNMEFAMITDGSYDIIFGDGSKYHGKKDKIQVSYKRLK